MESSSDKESVREEGKMPPFKSVYRRERNLFERKVGIKGLKEERISGICERKVIATLKSLSLLAETFSKYTALTLC